MSMSFSPAARRLSQRECRQNQGICRTEYHDAAQNRYDLAPAVSAGADAAVAGNLLRQALSHFDFPPLLPNRAEAVQWPDTKKYFADDLILRDTTSVSYTHPTLPTILRV